MRSIFSLIMLYPGPQIADRLKHRRHLHGQESPSDARLYSASATLVLIRIPARAFKDHSLVYDNRVRACKRADYPPRTMNGLCLHVCRALRRHEMARWTPYLTVYCRTIPFWEHDFKQVPLTYAGKRNIRKSEQTKFYSPDAPFRNRHMFPYGNVRRILANIL